MPRKKKGAARLKKPQALTNVERKQLKTILAKARAYKSYYAAGGS